MIDRFGSKVNVGFSEVELIYIRAAMQLPRGQRQQAFREIADLTGRSWTAVQQMAYRDHNQAVAQFAAMAPQAAPEGRVTRLTVNPVSGLKPPSMAALMAGKWSARKSVAKVLGEE